MSTPTRITHLVDGQPLDRHRRAHQPGLQPGDRRAVTGALDLASADLVGEVVASAAKAWQEWADTSLARRTKVLFAFRELLDQHKKEIAALITAEHGKVLYDALGEVTRGLEVVEFACGIPHLLKGGYSRERLDQRRRLLDPPAARRRRGHLAVQLPGHGADVVLPHRDRLRQRRRPQAEREGPLGRAGRRRAVEGGRPARRRHERRQRRQGGGRRAAHAPRRQVGVVRRAPRRSRKYVYETGTAHGKRVQALGGAKNHMLVLPDADLDLAADAAVNAGFGSAGERCMAISALVAVEPVADELVAEDQRPDGQAAHRRRHPRLRHGPARHRASTATR